MYGAAHKFSPAVHVPRCLAVCAQGPGASFPPMQQADMQRYRGMFQQMDNDRDGYVQASSLRHARTSCSWLYCFFWFPNAEPDLNEALVPSCLARQTCTAEQPSGLAGLFEQLI